MLYVSVALVVVLAVVVLAFTSILRWTIRQHARERERLVDQLCYLSGRTWNDPPSHVPPSLEAVPDWANTWESPAPEQMVA